MKDILREWIKKIQVFFSASSRSRTLTFLGMFFLVLVLPVTIIFLGQQTNFFQHAMVTGGGSGGTSGGAAKCIVGTVGSVFCCGANGINQCQHTVDATCVVSIKTVAINVKYCGYCSSNSNCLHGEICSTTTHRCVTPPSPTPTPAALPTANSVRCGTNNSGVCYFYNTKLAALVCDPNTYTPDYTKACNNNTFGLQTIPSCPTLTEHSDSIQVSGNTGSCLNHVGNTASLTRCCTVGTKPIGQSSTTCATQKGICTASHNNCPSGYSRDLNLDITCGSSTASNEICCTPIPPTNPTCTGTGGTPGTCFTNNSCGTGMQEVINQKSPSCSQQGYRICCTPIKTPTQTPTVCSQNGGICKSGSSQNAPTCTRLSSYDSSCQTTFGSSSFCCKGSVTTPSPTKALSGSTGTTGTPTSGNPTPGSNPIPTSIPCTNGKSTSMALTLKLDGIGTGTFENNSPAHATRNGLYVKVTDQNGTVLYNNTSTVFSYTNGTFNSPTVSLGTSLSCGHTYTVTVKIPQYVPATGTVTYGTSNVIALNPNTGDIDAITPAGVIIGNDTISVTDYSLVKACRNVGPTTPQSLTSGSTTVTVTCGNLINFIDYADGGTTGDEWSFNYNVWARGYFKANGY